MRERTRSEDLKVGSYQQNSLEGIDGCTVPYEDYCDWYISHEGTYVTVSKSEIMHDVVTPNFLKLSSEGKIINSPMDKTITVVTNPIASIISNNGYSIWAPGCATPVWKRVVTLREGSRPSSVYTGGEGGLLEQPSIDVESLISQAIIKAHANVSVSETMGLVMAAEGEKTVLSLISIFKRLIRILKSIRRLDLYRSSRDAKLLLKELTPKELADRYMELRYALRPLMYDCRDTVAALTKKASTQHDRYTFRGFTSKTVKADTVDQYNDDWSNILGVWHRHANLEKLAQRTVEVRAGVLTKIEEISGLATWGITEPFEAIWELVPFSFIVDWFFNVGDCISALAPNFGIKTLASWYVVTDTTYRCTTLTNSEGICPEGYDEEVYKDLFNEFAIKDCSYSLLETVTTRVPNPQLQAYPSFSLNLDAFKLADLAIIAKNIWR